MIFFAVLVSGRSQERWGFLTRPGQHGSLVECVLHGKKRQKQYMICNEDGTWQCDSSDPCKMTGREEEKQLQHEYLDVLNEVKNGNLSKGKGKGKLQQRAANQRRVNARGNDFGVVGMDADAYLDPNDQSKALCAIHGKQRLIRVMEPCPDGFKCRPGNECKR